MRRTVICSIAVMAALATGAPPAPAAPAAPAAALPMSEPSFSPDGRRIAFAGGTGARQGIYVIAVGGARATARRVTWLAAPGARDAAPTWSPDGRRIVFTRHRHTADGLELTALCVTDFRRHVRRITQWEVAAGRS